VAGGRRAKGSRGKGTERRTPEGHDGSKEREKSKELKGSAFQPIHGRHRPGRAGAEGRRPPRALLLLEQQEQGGPAAANARPDEGREGDHARRHDDARERQRNATATLPSPPHLWPPAGGRSRLTDAFQFKRACASLLGCFRPRPKSGDSQNPSEAKLSSDRTNQRGGALWRGPRWHAQDGGPQLAFAGGCELSRAPAMAHPCAPAGGLQAARSGQKSGKEAEKSSTDTEKKILLQLSKRASASSKELIV
jgi:hypothetical protein